MNVYDFLDNHKIHYERYDHPPVFTCEQAKKLVTIKGGADTKNLFLRDRKGKRHFLLVVGYDKSVDLKTLSTAAEVSKLGLASSGRLRHFLGIEPGSVSLLALLNDRENHVELIIDEAIWSADSIRCHPLVNTSTLVIDRDDIRRFFELTGHDPIVLNVPAKPMR